LSATPTERPAPEIAVSKAGQPFPAIPAEECSDTTLGRSIFQDGIFGSRTISDIRNQIELKYATCLSVGGHHGFPIQIDQIENPYFRQIAAAALVSKNWTTADLVSCHGRMEIPAQGILNAALESPIWGEDDYHVFRLLKSLKAYQYKADQGGRIL
jgi:hypothetical protein